MNVVLGTNAEVLVGPQVEEKIKEVIREAVGPQIDLNVAKFYLVTADCIKSRKTKDLERVLISALLTIVDLLIRIN
jgi:hypothetical protein